MIYSTDSSHRRPRALDSDAGVGTPQSFEDGHEEATTGGPGCVTSTRSVDSAGFDTRGAISLLVVVPPSSEFLFD